MQFNEYDSIRAPNFTVHIRESLYSEVIPQKKSVKLVKITWKF